MLNSSDDVNSSLIVTYGTCSVTVTNQSDKLFSSKCVNGYDYSEPRDRSFVSEVFLLFINVNKL